MRRSRSGSRGRCALLEARNAAARAAGYPDYPELVLTKDGLSKQSVRDLFDELERVTDPSYRAFMDRIASSLGVGRPELWDLGYASRRLGLPPDSAFPVDGIL